MNNYGDKKRSPLLVTVSWVGSVLSLLLVYFAVTAVVNDILSFRSCSTNNTGLSVVNCGRTNIGIGDVVLGLLLILSVMLCVSLFTGAWRASRSRKRA
jgi:hypothetical protein